MQEYPTSIINETSVSSIKDSSGRFNLLSPTEKTPKIVTLFEESFIVSRLLTDGEDLSGITSTLDLVFMEQRPRSETNASVRRALRVYSESKKISKVLRKLFSKYLWDKLSDLELEGILLMSIRVGENIILEAFRASQEGISQTLLRHRINAFQRLKGRKPFTRRELNSSRGFKIIILETEEFEPVKNTKKYSGWARHHNDQGSLRRGDKPYEFALPISSETLIEESIILREFLSVGSLSLSNRENESSLMMAIRKAETESFNKLFLEELHDDQSR